MSDYGTNSSDATDKTSTASLTRDIKIVEAAKQAREKAHAPYSNFKVGAALEDTDGNFHLGCNVENATYSLSVCAERVAIVKAISEGISSFRCIAVVADTDNLTPPCGACRQILWEFCGNAELIISNLKGVSEKMRVGDLLPRPFDKSFL